MVLTTHSLDLFLNKKLSEGNIQIPVSSDAICLLFQCQAPGTVPISSVFSDWE